MKYYIGAAIPDKGCFHLETFCYSYFQIKTVVTTARQQVAEGKEGIESGTSE